MIVESALLLFLVEHIPPNIEIVGMTKVVDTSM